ncbi:MAG: NRAMP family divalent metal transporter [Nitritalea sp.]
MQAAVGKKGWKLGPGAWVAAAFIGPGTVTVCSMAGVETGYSLLWVLVLGIGMTYCFQDAAFRLSLQDRRPLAQQFREELLPGPLGKALMLVLLTTAIGVGNTAYEVDNLSGAALGVALVIEQGLPAAENWPIGVYQGLLGLIVVLVLVKGSIQQLERRVVFLVAMLALAFMGTAVALQPAPAALVQGLVPRFQSDSILILSLLGTTVVPYNLFLHSGLLHERYPEGVHVRWVRRDLAQALLLGGLISVAIVITGAGSSLDRLIQGADLAEGLRPLLDGWAPLAVGLGLFAAGLSSALTAAFAGAYVLCSLFNWSTALRGLPMRLLMAGMVGSASLIALAGWNIFQLIALAQFTNALLLPLLSFGLWRLLSRRKASGPFFRYSLLFFAVLSLLLAAKGLWTLWLQMVGL